MRQGAHVLGILLPEYAQERAADCSCAYCWYTSSNVVPASGSGSRARVGSRSDGVVLSTTCTASSFNSRFYTQSCISAYCMNRMPAGCAAALAARTSKAHLDKNSVSRLARPFQPHRQHHINSLQPWASAARVQGLSVSVPAAADEFRHPVEQQLTNLCVTGKRRNKTHTLCRRCGRRSYHIQKSTCASCGYPAATKRTCEHPGEQVHVWKYEKQPWNSQISCDRQLQCTSSCSATGH